MRRRLHLLLAPALLLAACAGTHPGPGAPGTGGEAASGRAGKAGPAGPAAGEGTAAGGWTRVVSPFPVTGEGGRVYGFPFLGGLNVPRPQFVDVDGDGDLDLFLQERPNELVFFENAGTATEPRLVWRTDHFQGLDTGEWFRFVDLDRDGHPDLIAEEPFSLIRYYHNEDGRFVLATDTLRDNRGEPLFSDRQDIPNVVDIDANGLPDLFIGRLTGDITRYEATNTAGPVPAFRFITDHFQDISIVKQFGSFHGANTLTFADVDADGDPDLFWGDFFEPGLLFIRNTGTPRNPSLRGEPVEFPPEDPLLTSGYNAPAIADIDGDGDPDVFFGVLGGAYNPSRTTSENLYFLENTGTGYALRTRRYLGTIDAGAESTIAAGDVNGDGIPDLLVAPKQDPDELSTSRVLLFLSAGTRAHPSFALADTLPFRGEYYYAPHLADLDGDGLLDLLLGTWRDGLQVAWNRGTARAPRWVPADSPLARLSRGSNVVAATADLDGDGDLDLVLGESAGTLNLYRNGGSRSAPRFELVSDHWGDVDVGRRSAPAFVELDGALTLVVGNEDGELACFRPSMDALTPLDCGLPHLFGMAAPRFADMDGDGAPELLAGDAAGGVVYYRR